MAGTQSLAMNLVAAAPDAAPVAKWRAKLLAWLMPKIKHIWPPNNLKRCLAYGGVVAIMYAILYFKYIKVRRTAEAIAEDARKKKYVLDSLHNLLEYEDERQKLLNLAPKNEEPEKEPASAVPDGTVTPDKQEDELGSPTAKKLKPADAAKLYQLLFDDIENGPVTLVGVDPGSTAYQRGVEMLGTQTTVELKRAIARTKKAREAVKTGVDDLTDDGGTYKAREWLVGRTGCSNLPHVRSE